MSFSIYLHIPFCISKCPYCDFASIPLDQNLTEKYLSALLSEIKSFSGFKADTIYLGGGTPTVLKLEQLDKIMRAVKKHYTLTRNCEITIEANPNTLDEKKVAELKNIGFNRMSLGIQSFNDKELKGLGRIHTASQAIQSFNLLKKGGFKNIGLDLIFGIPEQTLNSWKSSLKKAIELSPQHISTYSLTIESETRFYQMEKEGKIKLPTDEKVRQMYLWAIDYLNLKGYKQYEISNFSLPGFESKHNLNYWNHKEYLGFGTSAHSFYKNKRWGNVRGVREYVELMKKKGRATEFEENLSRGQLITEAIFLGLRRIEGIDLKKFHKDFKVKLENIRKDKITRLIKLGFLSKQVNSLCLTKKALPVADSIIVSLI
ncbi:MAG: radical SAM family heme chaperone HemW [candidate division Zixibacteria bacterium]|nr:radical SAM family heme chaperone HemW [candidate division Zixibacteria bacterium]